MRTLDISHNLISKIENLENCIDLSYLNIGFNRISSLAEVNMTLGNIKHLILKSNAISSAEGLDKLYALHTLDLSDNIISNLDDVRLISELPFLTSLYLEGNPVSFHDNYQMEVFTLFCNSKREYETVWNFLFRHISPFYYVTPKDNFGRTTPFFFCKGETYGSEGNDSSGWLFYHL